MQVMQRKISIFTKKTTFFAHCSAATAEFGSTFGLQYLFFLDVKMSIVESERKNGASLRTISITQLVFCDQIGNQWKSCSIHDKLARKWLDMGKSMASGIFLIKIPCIYFDKEISKLYHFVLKWIGPNRKVVLQIAAVQHPRWIHEKCSNFLN